MNQEHVANREFYNEQRRKYMSKELTFQEFYLWLGSFINVGTSLLPVSVERIRESTDPHLNDIPLKSWERFHGILELRAFSRGLPWSLNNTVCVLKALAFEVAGIVQV